MGRTVGAEARRAKGDPSHDPRFRFSSTACDSEIKRRIPVGRDPRLAESLYLREALRGSFATLSKRFKLPVE